MKNVASVFLRATPANFGKTSKNVSLLESAWNTFNVKFVVGSPRNNSSSTQVRRDAV